MNKFKLKAPYKTSVADLPKLISLMKEQEREGSQFKGGKEKWQPTVMHKT